MGTTTPTSGPGSNTALVPSFVDGEGVEQPLPPTAPPKRFQYARAHFSRFAASGGSDHREMKRAVGSYVRDSMRGSHNAARRMGTPQTAARHILNILSEFGSQGTEKTLRQFDLQDLIGHGAQDVLLGITEFICYDGGQIDEAIARDAWLETVSEIEDIGVDNLDELSSDQIKQVFTTFVTHTIKARLYQDIGIKGFEYAKSLQDIDNFDDELCGYIERAVQDSFSDNFSASLNIADEKVQQVVEKTYSEAWELLQLQGDLAE